MTRSRALIKLGRVREQLNLLYDEEELLNGPARSGVREYKTETGGSAGRQEVKYRSLSEVQDAIARLESQEEWLLQKLNYRGIIYLNMKRRGRTGGQIG